MIVTTKENLIKAFKEWDAEIIDNPTKFDSIDETKTCAEMQAETLISKIKDEESLVTMKTNTVAEFIEFCNNEGFHISDAYFEEFFNA